MNCLFWSLILGLVVFVQTHSLENNTVAVLYDTETVSKPEQSHLRRNSTKSRVFKRSSRFLSRRRQIKNSGAFSLHRNKRYDYPSYYRSYQLQLPSIYDSDSFAKNKYEFDADSNFYGHSLEVQPSYTQINLIIPTGDSEEPYVESVPVGHNIVLSPADRFSNAQNSESDRWLDNPDLQNVGLNIDEKEEGNIEIQNPYITLYPTTEIPYTYMNSDYMGKTVDYKYAEFTGNYEESKMPSYSAISQIDYQTTEKTTQKPSSFSTKTTEFSRSTEKSNWFSQRTTQNKSGSSTTDKIRSTTKALFIDLDKDEDSIAKPTTEEGIALFEGSGDLDSRSASVESSGNLTKPARFIDFFSANDTCTTPKGEPGHCRSLGQCVLQDVVSNFNMYLQYMCVTRSAPIGICCPDNPVIEVTNPDEDSATPAAMSIIEQPPDGCGVNSRTRIVGGIVAKPHEWTWMVALLRNNRFFCGGVLINSQYVLTAAHCVMSSNIRDIIARLGEHDLNDKLGHQQDIPLAEVKRHAKFTTLTFQNDIALLKLRRPVEFSRFVGTICLPDGESNYTNVDATVAGWGTVAFGGSPSTILRQVTVPVWDNKECDRTYALETINESFLCAGSQVKEQDACQGDSGGPLMVLNSRGRWEVIGLVSWGRRCGDPNFPGVYTRVTTYLKWIEENAI